MRWIGALAVVPVAATMVAALARMNRSRAVGLNQIHGGGPGATQ